MAVERVHGEQSPWLAHARRTGRRRRNRGAHSPPASRSDTLQQDFRFGTVVNEQEVRRLSRQERAVCEIAWDGRWRTLREFEDALAARGIASSGTGVAAALRRL